MSANKIANKGERRYSFFSRCLTRRNRTTFRVFLRRIEYSAFVSRTPFFTVHLVGVRASRTGAKLQLQESCQDSTIHPPSVLPVACRPVVYSHSRDNNNPRLPCLFSRGEKIRGLEYCVYKGARLAPLQQGRKERLYSSVREKEEEIVLASCTFPCPGWLAHFFSALVWERRRESLFYSSAKT